MSNANEFEVEGHSISREYEDRGRRSRVLVVGGLFLVIMLASVGYIMAGDTLKLQASSFPALKDPPQIGKVLKAEGPKQSMSQAIRVGDPAPDFSFVDPTGAQKKLSDYKGQAVVINFWATWCPYCVNEMPDIEAVYRQEQEKGLVVLGISLDDEPNVAMKFLQLRGITFPSILDVDSITTELYRVQPIPASFFIDRGGILRDIQVGAMTRGTVEAKVGKIL